MIGDETNHLDVGNINGLGSVQNYWGTFRKDPTDGLKKGYRDVDNHGNGGGNFAFTDGHVEWIADSVGGPEDQNGVREGFDPHDKIFLAIQEFLNRGQSQFGTQFVQTVD